VARGRAFYHDRRYAEAKEEFDTAVRLNPDYPGVFEACGRTAYSEGDLEEAARHFRTAIQKDPDNFDSPLLLSQTLKGLGRDGEAGESLELGLRNAASFVERRPNHARALYMYAIALANHGDETKALEMIDRALAIDVEDPMILYGTACVYSLTGRVEEAISHLEKALAAGCSHTDWVGKDTDLDPLRDHPRFKSLIERLS
jgi:adenylate cyclase